jgi:DNA-binding Lrp family transcriptional regulator
MPVGFEKLLQRKFLKLVVTVSELLEIPKLENRKDQIIGLVLDEFPLVFDNPRFGVVEKLVESKRGGWEISVSEGIQEEPLYVLEWVLWREAILALLAPQIRQVPEVADLGLYGGLKYGFKKTKVKDHLLDLWKQVSPTQYHVQYRYDPTLGFPIFDNIVDGAFLQRVIPWLNSLRGIHREGFSSAAYTEGLERWMLETYRVLNTTEVEVLVTLAENPTVSQTEIAKKLNMSNSMLSQVLQKLAEKHLLRLYNHVNMPLIGLEEVIVFFTIPKTISLYKFTRYLNGLKYLTNIQHFSSSLIFATFVIPLEYSMKFHLWLDQLGKKTRINFELKRVNDSILSWNFNSYIPDKGWPTDFSEILDEINILIKGIDTDLEPKIKIVSHSYDLIEKSTRFPIKLNSEDFTYFLRATDAIYATQRFSSRTAEELRKAGLKPTEHMRYRRRIKKLENWGISEIRGYFLYIIGLNSAIQMIIYEPREITKDLFQKLQLLPFIVGRILDEGSGCANLLLPNEVVVDVYSFLRKLFAREKYNVRFSLKPAWQLYVGGPGPLLISDYNLETGRWIWIDEEIPRIEVLKK